ncbi:invasion associated locus B family protein [Hyphomonas sp.]|uniref:invasion associated locus B family protein n=1 Tax=Hyphomonas sp. TaxID=87 RepID=UPI00391AC817
MQQKMTIRRAALMVVIASAVFAQGAHAQQEAQGRFRDWAVFTEQRGNDLVCYAATQATSRSPTSVNHGDVWYHVTSWRSGAARNQPSVKVGYNFREGSAPRLTIGRSSWTKFAAGSEAFAEDSDDPRIVSAIRAGSTMSLTATSARGTNVTYRFSLAGSAAAIDKAAELCR